MKTSAHPLTPEAGVARWLRRHCKERPDQIAVRQHRGHGWDESTFRELDQLVDRTCHALVRAGIERGMRTVLMVEPGLEFLACTFAMLRMGVPPVLIDPGMGISGLASCLQRARPRAFIGIPRAHRARALLGWSRSTIEHRISVGQGWMPPFTRRLEDWRKRTEASVPFSAPVLDSDETAAILFTSGLDVGLIMFPLTEFPIYEVETAYEFTNPLAIAFGFWGFLIWLFYFVTTFYFCVIEPRLRLFEIPWVKRINNGIVIATCAFTGFFLCTRHVLCFHPEFPISSCLDPSASPSSTKAMVVALTNTGQP